MNHNHLLCYSASCTLAQRPLPIKPLIDVLWAISLLLVLWACKKEPLISIELKVGKQTIKAELALSPEQQAQGLMHRQSMAEMHGMLFSFPQDKVLRFYMKNTLIPLSIAYLDKDGIICEIYHMQPLDTTTIASRWPMRFALELNQGWFERHNVDIGQRVTLLDGSPLKHSQLQQQKTNE